MSAKYTITVKSGTDNNALRHQLLLVVLALSKAPKVISVDIEYDTARGRVAKRYEHNPVVKQ